MFSVQQRLPFILPQRARMRRMRRPFTPSQEGRGPYRLPHAVHERLAADLKPFRNREAAYTLAVFIARYHSGPWCILEAFPIDRRELAEHPELDLTEAKIRGAIATLETIGFLERTVMSGSTHKPTPDGLHRKPIKFTFGSDYAAIFIMANERARAAKGGGSRDRRPIPAENARRIPAENARRPSTPCPAASGTSSPKNKSVAVPSMILGELVKADRESGIPPLASESDPRLEAALDRLLQGIRQSRGG